MVFVEARLFYRSLPRVAAEGNALGRLRFARRRLKSCEVLARGRGSSLDLECRDWRIGIQLHISVIVGELSEEYFSVLFQAHNSVFGGTN